MDWPGRISGDGADYSVQNQRRKKEKSRGGSLVTALKPLRKRERDRTALSGGSDLEQNREGGLRQKRSSPSQGERFSNACNLLRKLGLMSRSAVLSR